MEADTVNLTDLDAFLIPMVPHFVMSQ